MTASLCSYEEARSFLADAAQYGIVPGLDTMKALCKKLCNPQDKLHAIHIAGTNGKGSVGAILSAVLSGTGKRIGRYVSPAVADPLEIISINGRSISPTDYGLCIGEVRQACRRMTAEGLPHPTPFEIETAAAFLYFSRQSCDFVLIEAGMGGRLDATNILTSPVLSVITSISMDHTAFLGDTLEEIAFEKAGIIKPGCPVAAMKGTSAVNTVIEQTAAACSCQLIWADAAELYDVKPTLSGTVFSCPDFSGLTLSLPGIFQAENALLAIRALKALPGVCLSEKQLREGLVNTHWPFRFQVLSETPLILADGSHNADGAARLAETAAAVLTGKKIGLIIGVFRDKDYPVMAKILSPLADKVWTVTPPTSRGLPAEDLAQVFCRLGKPAVSSENVNAAIRQAFSENADCVLCCGSLSFLHEIDPAQAAE